jgi:hypothetical protein
MLRDRGKLFANNGLAKIVIMVDFLKMVRAKKTYGEMLVAFAEQTSSSLSGKKLRMKSSEKKTLY